MSLHRSVREGIAAVTLLQNGHSRPQHGQDAAAAAAFEEEEEDDDDDGLLLIRGRRWEQPVNLYSIQHLVDFLRHATTESNNNNQNNNESSDEATAPSSGATAATTTTSTSTTTTAAVSVVGITHLKLHAVTIHNRHQELTVLRDYFLQEISSSSSSSTRPRRLTNKGDHYGLYLGTNGTRCGTFTFRLLSQQLQPQAQPQPQ
jgi:hypothetical protein